MKNIENTLGFHGESIHSFKIFKGSLLIPIDRRSSKYIFFQKYLTENLGEFLK